MAKKKINENWFSGGYMGPGLGMDWTLSPASYTVQGSGTGYVYALRTFDDSLQQKPNEPSFEYYIHPGDMVEGVGYNNPDKIYRGRVYRIVKGPNGEIVYLYILSSKTSKFVSIRPDDNLTLLIPKTPDQSGMFYPASSQNVEITNRNIAAQ